MVGQGLLIKRVSGGVHLLSLDDPCPTIMADGIGGICRRGWQYAIVGGTTLIPSGLVPPEGSPVDSAGELAAIRALEQESPS